jgi:hypothetical protein
MNLHRARVSVSLLGTLLVGLTNLGVAPSALAQGQSPNDRLTTFVGTWQAKTAGENAPWLILKFRGTNGTLIGTLSHFTLGVIGTGTVVGKSGLAGESAISDITIGAADLSFTWKADPPLQGGRMQFVVEGTQTAYLILPVSRQEMETIMRQSPGASGFNPIVSLTREKESSPQNKTESSVQNWEAGMMARLINSAEAQYRFTNGRYASYSTLLRSGQLKETSSTRFTVVPGDLQSEADPLPGYEVRLLVSPDGGAYQLSILDKKACGTDLFTDESGVVFEGRPNRCRGN